MRHMRREKGSPVSRPGPERTGVDLFACFAMQSTNNVYVLDALCPLHRREKLRKVFDAQHQTPARGKVLYTNTISGGREHATAKEP